MGTSTSSYSGKINPPSTASGRARAPIVYSSGYNISFWGMENLHPFDSKKYEKVYNQLVQEKVLESDQVYLPSYASEEQLLTVHTAEYLDSLSSTTNVASIVEVPPVAALPISAVRGHVLQPMLLATGGTLLGAHLAAGLASPPYLEAKASKGAEADSKVKHPSSRWHDEISRVKDTQSLIAAEEKQEPKKHGWSINLSGGYHHACHNQGGGFCIYSDISMAIMSVAKHSALRKFMIVDLDAHQGNGHERDKVAGVYDSLGVLVFTLDMYNSRIYPYDIPAKAAIDCPVELRPGTGDETYLPLLEKHLTESLEKFKPEMVVYNAGTDCLAGDPLGQLNISADGIVLRDEIVFRECIARQTPVVMLLSGGYQKSNAAVIARSIVSLDQKFGLIDNGLKKQVPTLPVEKKTTESHTQPETGQQQSVHAAERATVGHGSQGGAFSSL